MSTGLWPTAGVIRVPCRALKFRYAGMQKYRAGFTCNFLFEPVAHRCIGSPKKLMEEAYVALLQFLDKCERLAGWKRVDRSEECQYGGLRHLRQAFALSIFCFSLGFSSRVAIAGMPLPCPVSGRQRAGFLYEILCHGYYGACTFVGACHASCTIRPVIHYQWPTLLLFPSHSAWWPARLRLLLAASSCLQLHKGAPPVLASPACLPWWGRRNGVPWALQSCL